MKNILEGFFEILGVNGKPVRGAFLASGGGTTAWFYMICAKSGFIPWLVPALLICTKKEAGAAQKAEKLEIPHATVARSDYESLKDFNIEIARVLKENKIEIAFTAGCIHKILPVEGVYFVNNHPAPTLTDGGKGMYDRMVHEHVIERIMDDIRRHPEKIHDVHRTCVTHHEVFRRKPPFTEGMDTGTVLSEMWVDILPKIIEDCYKGKISTEEAAKLLQKHVMQYEYVSIISNASAGVLRVLHAREYGIKLGGGYEG